MGWARGGRVGMGAAVVVALLGGCGSAQDPAAAEEVVASPSSSPTPSPSPTPMIGIHGGIGLGPGASMAGLSDDFEADDEACVSYGPTYSTIKGGVQVQVLDAGGAVVGVTQLDNGKVFEPDCAWMFRTEVPAGGRFYTVRILDWTSDAIPEAEAGTTTFIVDPTK